MSVEYCQGLKNFSHDLKNVKPIRIALFNDCRFTSILILKSVISGLKRPFIFTFQDKIISGSDGNWTGIHGNLMHNRSDIMGSLNSINLFRFNMMHFSPRRGLSQ